MCVARGVVVFMQDGKAFLVVASGACTDSSRELGKMMAQCKVMDR